MKKTTTQKGLVITRNFDAPRKLVWEAWTNPQKVKQWWGPKGYSCPYSEMDLREGGTYLNCMRSHEGKDYWSTGTYKQIDAPEKLVITDSFADPDGNIVPASYYGMGDEFPLSMEISVTFKQINNKTRMVLNHKGMPKGEISEEAKRGWNESFDKLAAMLVTS